MVTFLSSCKPMIIAKAVLPFHKLCILPGLKNKSWLIYLGSVLEVMAEWLAYFMCMALLSISTPFGFVVDCVVAEHTHFSRMSVSL